MNVELKLIVGLGNPGSKYEKTRHNIGFMAIDHLASELGLPSPKKQAQAELFNGEIDGNKFILVKPQTFMNLSGESVQELMGYYKVLPSDLLVIHDEVDQPFASIKFQTKRGHGGHNGIRNIHALLGTEAYDRLRLGVGKSLNPNIDTATHVLSPFSMEEFEKLKKVLEIVSDGLRVYIKEGFQKAATQFNQTL